MKIVTARKEDLGLIRKISHETIKSVYPAYYPAGAVAFFLAHHSEEHIAADIADGKVWILYDEGNPVGTITISGSNINRLFVLPEYQHRGYGKAMLDYAETKILESQNCVLVDASLPAKQIYLRRGYKEIEYDIIKTDNGDFLCFDIMRLGKNDQRS